MKIAEKIIIVTLAAVLVFQFILNSNMRRLNDELNGRVDSLNNMIMMLKGNFSSEVSSIMNRIQEGNTVIRSVQWEPVEMNGGLVTVKCDACFNQIASESHPYLLYRSEALDKWNKIELEHQEGLNYSVKINLKPQETYSYQIFIDGETQYSGNIVEIDRYLYKYADFRGVIPGGYNHLQENTTPFVHIYLEPMSKAVLKPLQIQSAEVVLYNAGKKLDNIIMQVPENSMEDSKAEHFGDTTLEVEMPLSANLDMESYNEVIDRITVKVTYNDGYTVEKEVYPKTEE